MGLDQSIYRIKKPNLEDRVYTSAEISDLDLRSVAVSDFEENESLFKQLLPYVVKRDVECQFYDKEKMIADYNLPKDSYIWRYTFYDISLCGHNENGERVEKTISNEEVEEKYTLTKIVPHYIWYAEEEYYWRKDYEVSDWIANNMKCNVENTGYYRLNKTIISRLNRKFKTDIPEESATKESALFYWEWY